MSELNSNRWVGSGLNPIAPTDSFGFTHYLPALAFLAQAILPSLGLRLDMLNSAYLEHNSIINWVLMGNEAS